MSVRRALGITAIAQIVNFVLGFTSVVIVSRLLTPAEIGIFSVAASLIYFAHILREFGVAEFLIQTPTLTADRLRAAFTVTLGFSWALAIILLLVRDSASTFYGNDGIGEVLGLISINFVLMPFGTPLLSLLRREMQFGKIALVNILSALSSASVTIGAAYLGQSYLSMAWGSLAGHVTNVLVLNCMRRSGVFMLPTFRGLGEIVRFGSLSFANSIITQLGNSAPDLIFGRTLGLAAVGYYSRADGLRKMAVEQISTVVRRVYLPSFAKSIRGGSDAAELYARSMSYLVGITAPALALLSFLATPVILFLFGPQWDRAANLASLVCFFAILLSPTTLAGVSLVAAGRMRMLVQTQFVAKSLRIAAFASSVWLGLEQTLLVLGLAYLAELLLFLRALRLSFGLQIRALWGALRTSYLLIPYTLFGPSLVRIAQVEFDLSAPLVATLLLSAVLAAAGWLTGVVLLRHPFRREFGDLWRRLQPTR